MFFFTKKDCLRLFLKERWNDPLAMILGETVWGQVFGARTNLGRNFLLTPMKGRSISHIQHDLFCLFVWVVRSEP